MVDEVGRAWCPLLACVVHRAVGSSRVSGLSEAAASVGRPAVELLKERDIWMWGGVVLCRGEVESGWLVDRSSWALLGGEDARREERAGGARRAWARLPFWKLGGIVHHAWVQG